MPSPVVPAFERPHWQRRAFTADHAGILQPDFFAQAADRLALRKAFVCAARANADCAAVRKHPAVEIGRGDAVVVDFAAGGQKVRRAVFGRSDDLVIREHTAGIGGAWHRLLANFGACTVRTDDSAGLHLLWCAVGIGVVDDADVVRRAAQAFETAVDTRGTASPCPLTQPLVEMLAVDHAHEAVVDRDIDPDVFGRHHPCRGGACHQKRLGDEEIGNQTRWNRTAAGLDAARAINQQNAVTGAREIIRCGGTCRATADHDCVKYLCHFNPFMDLTIQ